MREVVLADEVDWEGWRTAARALVHQGVPPEQVVWSVGESRDLFGAAGGPSGEGVAFSVPRALVELAQTVIQARDPERFALLYRLLWRIRRGERGLLEVAVDPDVQRAARLAQSVRRDTHKMRAFLRFREVQADDATRYVAWFEPAHFIVEANAAFFVRRFATMTWSILTPYRSVHWDGADIRFAGGADPAEVPDDDALAAYWRTYFISIFNPARLKVAAMTAEMPRKYWRNLPEAAAIPDLVRSARERTDRMVDQPVFSPPRRGRAKPEAEGGDLRSAAEACRLCPLWQNATQTVFGEGPADAEMMLVGEQPGDQEDLAGRPFVGPAGQMLDRALVEAGIDRATLYLTNAVKHFKFSLRGRRRIHQKPDVGEIAACGVWLEREREAVRPSLIVALGATAARAVMGRAVSVTRERGLHGNVVVTVHPSYLLRLPDEATRLREFHALVADLRVAAARLRDNLGQKMTEEGPP
jgi:DNA polymerase